mmetsp:Transcript_4712/g.7006  ORF Transcript_4712/g.7006 Transcript_4712/m.7006 type:complete len:117 (+) Transcript_4712:212-562(+)
MILDIQVRKGYGLFMPALDLHKSLRGDSEAPSPAIGKLFKEAFGSMVSDSPTTSQLQPNLAIFNIHEKTSLRTVKKVPIRRSGALTLTSLYHNRRQAVETKGLQIVFIFEQKANRK